MSGILRPSRRELLIATGLCVLFGARAAAEPSVPRRLKLKNANTGETFDGPYRDAQGPIVSAISDLAVFLRDHHANQAGPVHVDTLDFLADVMEAVGQSAATILSAYRTPETNAMLATYIVGVAEKSQHLLGRALDVTFDARLADARTAALKMERGGVGWYPRSNFIHLDTGPLRSWERDGSDIELLFAGRERRAIAVAQSYTVRRPVASAAAGPHLPPCREATHSGVLVVRGSACAL
ncbi:MAG TPA: DUF882 domain-containing protein [Stellaceae bacterium]|nr:DUF882 domain-containing protein [Stellaceae bacterium]